MACVKFEPTSAIRVANPWVPDVCWKLVFQFCSTARVWTIASVCRQWCRVSHHPQLAVSQWTMTDANWRCRRPMHQETCSSLKLDCSLQPSVEEIAEYHGLTHITALDLPGSKLWTRATLPNVQILLVRASGYPLFNCRGFIQFPNLTDLHLVGDQWSGIGNRYLCVRALWLRRLSITGWTSGRLPTWDCPRLQEIVFNSCRLDGDDLDGLTRRAVSLRTVTFDACQLSLFTKTKQIVSFVRERPSLCKIRIRKPEGGEEPWWETYQDDLFGLVEVQVE